MKAGSGGDRNIDDLDGVGPLKLRAPDDRHTVHVYSAFAYSVGYQKTATVCGRTGCERSALVWLTEGEQLAHNSGQRVFDDQPRTGKFRVSATKSIGKG